MGRGILKKSSLTKDLQLQGYVFKLYYKILLKREKARLQNLLSNRRRNPIQIAACKLLIVNLENDIKNRTVKEELAYKVRYKEPIGITIKKAKTGDRKSIYRLIEWDKHWLFEDWMKNKILIAEGIDNRSFLDNIADSIKSRKNKSKTAHSQFYRELLDLKIHGFNFNDPAKVNYLRGKLFKIYEQDDNNPIYKLVFDQDYFTKYLIRHKLKDGQ